MLNNKPTAGYLQRSWGIYAAASASIFLGALIYLFLRPVPFIFLNWIDFYDMALVHSLRPLTVPLHTRLPEWMVFSLTNGLWTFAYALIMTHIWWGRRSFAGFFWLASVPLLGVCHELAQFFGFIPGTFCYQDLLAGFIGACLGFWVVFQKKIKKAV